MRLHMRLFVSVDAICRCVFLGGKRVRCDFDYDAMRLPSLVKSTGFIFLQITPIG